MSRDRHDEIAELLQSRLEELRKRDAARSPNRRIGRRPPSGPESSKQLGEPLDSGRLRKKWIARQKGRDIAEMLGGRTTGSSPDLVEVSTFRKMPIGPCTGKASARNLEKALWLVPGIREKTMRRLARSGCSDLTGLVGHPRFGRQAGRLLRMMEKGDTRRLMDRMAVRSGRGHPLALTLAQQFEPGDLLFLDIETMGLFGGSPIVQVGLAWIREEGIEVRQLVAGTLEAEAALVEETVAVIAAHPALVTFNGRSFDFPYICQRAAFYGSPVAHDPVHFDLLPFSRRFFRGRTTDCRLDTLAREVLGMERDEDVPGALVPLFYQEYLQDPEHRFGLLAAIVTHNLDDMVQMVRLYGRLLALNGDDRSGA